MPDPITQSFIESAQQMPMVRSTRKLEEETAQRGVRVGTAHVPGILERNAYFLSRENAEKFIKLLEERKLPYSEIKRIKNSIKDDGLILTGKYFKRRGIVEHEAGHAIARKKGQWWERWTQHPWTNWVSVLSGGPGAALGFGLGYRRGILPGLIGGAVPGLIGNIPLLVREMAANKYAKQLMDPDLAEKMPFGKQVGGYALGRMVPTVAAGLSAAILGRTAKTIVEKYPPLLSRLL